jgi:hypothetical protein
MAQPSIKEHSGGNLVTLSRDELILLLDRRAAKLSGVFNGVNDSPEKRLPHVCDIVEVLNAICAYNGDIHIDVVPIMGAKSHRLRGRQPTGRSSPKSE